MPRSVMIKGYKLCNRRCRTKMSILQIRIFSGSVSFSKILERVWSHTS